MRKMIFISFLVFSILASASEDEVDHMALASMLIRDGHFIRAEKTLKNVKEDEVDKAKLASLQGMILLHKKDYEEAIRQFEKAIDKGLMDSEIYIYLSEAELRLKHYVKAQFSLDKAGEKEKQKLPYYLLSAEIAWQQGEKIKAWQQLNVAENKGLNLAVLMKKRFSYLMEEKLYFSAKELAFKAMQARSPFVDILAMASQLRVAKQYDLSLLILQALAFKSPHDETLNLELAQNYIAKKENFSAGLILEEAARVQPSLAFEAAEILRQQGKVYRAQYLNLMTPDPEKKLKQKLALYIEEEDYHSIPFMMPQLRQYNLLEDQDIRYALAYSFFRAGDLDQSEKQIQYIQRDDLFEKSIELRKEISKCKENGWACSETI
ncbi:MAG: hypothetical protein KDD33_12345 [Bdellovibrionales bacterium]|nr:hypothetical protein [Bdellovibrionales bacterium]